MRFDITREIAISAGAGSGKTYTLSRRYLNVLVGFNLFTENPDAPIPEVFEPTSPAAIVTITYTEAGALEMRSRIYALVQKVLAHLEGRLDKKDGDYRSIAEAIGRLRSARPELEAKVRESLAEALAWLPEATIGTIHAYCLELIDCYGDFLGLDARPEVAAEADSRRLFDEAWRETLEARRELVERIDAVVPLYAVSNIAERYSFDAGFRRACESFAKDPADANATLKRIWRAARLLPHREIFVEGIPAVRAMARLDERKAALAEAIEANALALLRGRGEWHGYTGQLRGNKAIEEVFPAVKSLRDTVGTLWDELHADEEGERIYEEVLGQIYALLVQIHAAYREKLVAEGYTDFETILEMADRLLACSLPLTTRYFMVDEFQDTNDFQWGIVKKAAAKTNANLFIVGDEKQSIFSFQGADVATFAKARKDLGVEPLNMDINRRSDRRIIDFVNTVFAGAMAPREAGALRPLDLSEREEAKEAAELLDALLEEKPLRDDFEARYEPLKPSEKAGEGNVALLITPVDGDDDEEVSATEREMRHIAMTIKEAVSAPDRCPEAYKAYRKGEKAVAVLMDTRTHMLLLKRVLEEAGLAAKVADSGEFYDTKEVNDLFIVMKLLTMMGGLDFDDLTGRQKYAVVGALRSNLLRLDADAVEEALRNGKLPDILWEWCRRAAWQTPAETIEMLVDQSGLLHLYRELEDFAQREANIAQLVGMAESYALGRGADLKGFVRELERCIHDEAIGEDEAFVAEEGTGSIEIRTIHSAKGLEWPLVILANAGRSFMGRQPSESLVFDRYERGEVVGFKVGDYTPLAYRFAKARSKAKHIAERKRLLYVALTRAEHHLMVSAAITRKSNKKGYGYSLCRNCGENNYFTLIQRALKLDLEALYERRVGKVPGGVGLRYPGAWRPAPAHRAVAVAPMPAFEPVPSRPRRIVRPSGEPETGTFWKWAPFDAADAGTVVHKILEECWQRLEDEECLLKWLDRFEVPESWRSRIVLQARSFRKTPHYVKLTAGAEHYFEYDFVYTDEEGEVRGSIDLFYYDEERDGWVVVDFKTVSEAKEECKDLAQKAGYDKQLEYYKEYLEKLNIGSVVDTQICWLYA